MTDDQLLRRAARAAAWNATVTPITIVMTLATSILVRRALGLEGSGVYDVTIGLVNSLLLYTNFGLHDAVLQFVSRLEPAGARAVLRFLVRVAGLRIGAVVVLGTAVAWLAEPVAARLGLGQDGVLLVTLAALVASARAAGEFVIRCLQALLSHGRANLLELLRATLIVAGAAVALNAGFGVPALLAILAATSVLVAVVGSVAIARQLQLRPAVRDVPWAWNDVAAFASISWGSGWLNYFASLPFATLALAALGGGSAAVALLNTAFQLPRMTIVMALSSLQGLYQPLFARLVAEPDKARLRGGFQQVAKLEFLLLMPAGVGLFILAPDLITGIFGSEFAGAGGAARLLIALTFLAPPLDLGEIVLMSDRRYRLVTVRRLAALASAPLIVLAASRADVMLMAAALGAAPVLKGAIMYAAARREYGLRFPLAFLARVAAPCVAMAVAVLAARSAIGVTPGALALLCMLGIVVFAATAVRFRVLGSEELELIARSGIPGRDLIVRMLG